MAKIGNIIGGCFITLCVLIPAVANGEPNTGTGPTTFNCTGVPATCGAWGPKGPNTCRTCQQAQCKTENGKEVIAGNKTTTECYEGHGSPPAVTGGRKGDEFNKAPSGTLKQQ